ncbi:MAG: hypothetical protein H6726_12730 [Sandaracinaceae bacterium]|nr:hypothetical protein [Sandaracinaceae bacterium]
MIRVVRGPEPAELTAKRVAKLLNAADSDVSGASVRFDGYGIAKRALFAAQHGKCAYCERVVGYDSQPVEHFRPKGGARPATLPNAGSDARHYWWLAWTWENLFFACVSCNGVNRKGNWFPLATGERLSLPDAEQLRNGAGPAFEVHREDALLLDPAQDDASEHLRWVPRDRRVLWERFRYVLVAVTPRGQVTLERLGLALLEDEVNRHVRATLIPLLRQANGGAWGPGHEADLAELLSDQAPYAGASRSVFSFLCDYLALQRGDPSLPPSS